MEDVSVDAFGLVEADDRLHQRVVVGVADRADGGGDLLHIEMLGEPDRGGLAHCRSGAAADPARPGSLCRSRSHNAIHSGIRTRSVTLVVAACQPHDQLGEHVDDEGDVDEPAQVLQ